MKRARRRAMRKAWKAIRVMVLLTIVYLVGAGVYVSYKDFERSITPPSKTQAYQKSDEDYRIKFAVETSKENRNVSVVTSGKEHTVVTFITTQKRLQELSDEVLDETSIELLSLYGFKELRITCPDFKQDAVIVNLETGKVERLSF